MNDIKLPLIAVWFVTYCLMMPNEWRNQLSKVAQTLWQRIATQMGKIPGKEGSNERTDRRHS